MWQAEAAELAASLERLPDPLKSVAWSHLKTAGFPPEHARRDRLVAGLLALDRTTLLGLQYAVERLSETGRWP